MRKLFIFLLSVSLASIATVLASGSVSANDQKGIIKVNNAPTLIIPATSAGPGLILPDSPLFFIDKIKQEFRLLLAFTPEQKARIHSAVAGERLAELRLMLAKNDESGIRIALQGISDNSKAASRDLLEANLTGRDISSLAKEINDSVKEKQDILYALGNEATGEMRMQIMTAKAGLNSAKASARAKLPGNIALNEIVEDMNREIKEDLIRGKASLMGARNAVSVLTRLATQAASIDQPLEREFLINANVENLISELQKASSNLQKDVSEITTTK